MKKVLIKKDDLDLVVARVACMKKLDGFVAIVHFIRYSINVEQLKRFVSVVKTVSQQYEELVLL